MFFSRMAAPMRLMLGLTAGVLNAGSVGCGKDDAVGAPPPTAGEVGGPESGPRSGACETMTAKLQWQYEAARACTQDDQCNYIDEFLEVIRRDESDRTVTVLECGGRTPFLMYANGARLARERAALLDAQRQQAKACADPVPEDFAPPVPEDTCQARVDFTADTPPICRDGRCKAVRGDGYQGE